MSSISDFEYIPSKVLRVDSGLGIIPLALPGAITAGAGLISAVGSIFGKKDNSAEKAARDQAVAMNYATYQGAVAQRQAAIDEKATSERNAWIIGAALVSAAVVVGVVVTYSYTNKKKNP